MRHIKNILYFQLEQNKYIKFCIRTCAINELDSPSWYCALFN